MISSTLIVAVAITLVVVTLLVAARFLGCLIRSLKSRHYLYAVASVLGILCIAGALGAVVVVWFAYAVAHSGKGATTDLKVFLCTIPPFFLVAVILWLLGGKLRLLHQRRIAGQDTATDATE